MKNLLGHHHNDDDDDDDSRVMGMNSSYIHHVHSRDEDDDDATDYGSTADIIAKHLQRTASKEYEHHQQPERFQTKSNRHRSSSTTSSSSRRSKNNTTSNRRSASTLEDTYTRAMNRVSKSGDYYYHEPQQQQQQHHDEEGNRRVHPGLPRPSNTSSSSRRSKHSSTSQKSKRSTTTSSSTTSERKDENLMMIVPSVPKKSVSDKDPSEETIAIFGAYGVTGHYFLQLALEAGYNVRALLLPGMTLEDVVVTNQLRLITGSFDEEEKVRRVCKNASYVVCLLNDCDKSFQQTQQEQDATTCSSSNNRENLPPLLYNHSHRYSRESNSSHKSNQSSKQGSKQSTSQLPHSSSSNWQFVQTLLPILQDLDMCRVLLYQASAVAKDDKGSTPIFGNVVKKLAVKKETRHCLREQDRIVKYIVQTTQTMSLNYIVTRPNSNAMIWDRPSRKKLAASKSQPGPFPITNIDLAEFTLGALRMGKLFNSCPYVVQDGI